MSLPARSSDSRAHVLPDPASHDLLRAWAAVIVMVVLLVGGFSIMNRLEWDPSFAVAMLVFGAFVVVLLLLGMAAFHFGRRARDLGRGSGVVPAAIGGAIGGYFLLLAVATLVGHLLGME